MNTVKLEMIKEIVNGMLKGNVEHNYFNNGDFNKENFDDMFSYKWDKYWLKTPSDKVVEVAQDYFLAQLFLKSRKIN